MVADVSLIPESDMEETQSFPETPTSRLVAHILSIVLPLMTSKDKTVRYRSTQLVAHIINSLDSIDDEYYHRLRMALLKWMRDKEPSIRVQAVLGLGRLAANEDDEAQDRPGSEDDEAFQAARGVAERPECGCTTLASAKPTVDARNSAIPP